MQKKLLIYHSLKPKLYLRKEIYEKYILEIVNASTYFTQKYGIFEKPILENNGQCDAISNVYSLDFKRMLARDLCEIENLSRDVLIDLGNGGFGCVRHKSDLKNTNATLLLNAIKDKTLIEVENIINSKQKNQVEREIAYFFSNVINVKKNILIYVPARFEVNKETRLDNNLNIVLNEFSKTLFSIGEFRCKYQKNYDTYLIFLFEENFVLCKFDNRNLVFKDLINKNRSQFYYELTKKVKVPVTV